MGSIPSALPIIGSRSSITGSSDGVRTPVSGTASPSFPRSQTWSGLDAEPPSPCDQMQQSFTFAPVDAKASPQKRMSRGVKFECPAEAEEPKRRSKSRLMSPPAPRADEAMLLSSGSVPALALDSARGRKVALPALPQVHSSPQFHLGSSPSATHRKLSSLRSRSTASPAL
eukprot:RCo052012